MKILNKLYLSCVWIPLVAMFSCTDDGVMPEAPETQPEDTWVDPNIPDEIKNGYSITFNMSLDPYGGPGTRTTNTDLLNIDNFIDLEKVRILFFVCANEGNGTKAEADTTHVTYYSPNRNQEKKPFFTGKNDHFLFESKSRWVSQLQDDESTTAQWQVTAPVFTYGNNDEYRWEDIRYTLENYPFKVVILANRPDVVNFGDFDGKFGEEVVYPTGRGPIWGPEDTWIPVERRKEEEKDDPKWNSQPTINDLHHCQWDAVYASKNSGDKSSTSNPYGGSGVYSFIMLNPKENEAKDNGKIKQPSNEKDEIEFTNRMGALSTWTYKPDGKTNYYFHPNYSQGIPMYGVQVFDPIPDWKEGSPYNVSAKHTGQSGELIRKNIYLLRSLVKIELIIPRQMEDKNGKMKDITVSSASLRFSNVMARCEPLDVATPMERIWHNEHESNNDPCEWFNIQEYGPIINKKVEDDTNGQGSALVLQDRMAWFYGAWRDWWHFNMGKSGVTGLEDVGSFDRYSTKPYPRIFNPVIQRNDDANIAECLVDNDDSYHYVIYTGERNINDPTQFGQTDSYKVYNAKSVYFMFKANDVDYIVPLCNYATGSLASTFKFDPNLDSTGTATQEGSTKKFWDQMGKSTNPDDWNYAFLRNHVYTFTIRSFGDYNDRGGIDVKVVSTEKREAPGLWFN